MLQTSAYLKNNVLNTIVQIIYCNIYKSCNYEKDVFVKLYARVVTKSEKATFYPLTLQKGTLVEHRFWPCLHSDLDFEDMSFGQGYDTPLDQGQKWLCKILHVSRSNMAVISYGPDTNFGYVSTVTLTLAQWLWLNVMAHPWVMDNNCMTYYQESSWQ